MRKLIMIATAVALAACGDDDGTGQDVAIDTRDDSSVSDAEVTTDTTTTTGDGTGPGDGDTTTVTTTDATGDATDATLADGEDADVEPGTFGAPCNQNKDCLSGWCVTSDEGPVCTRQCAEDCPDGWSCLGIAGQVDITFLCVPRQDRLCQPCFIDDQCNDGYCLTFEEGRRCTASCSDDEDCPGGYRCEMAQSEAVLDRRSTQCVPIHETCACLPGNEGLAEPCNVSNADGSCWGTRTCLGEPGWSACDAPTPEAELCDGLDNDCNLFVDEDVAGVGAACELINDFGACEGTTRCDGAAGLACVAPTPAPEACNYLDDDCDGTTDEGFADVVTGLYVDDANCGVCGNACEGLFPNAISGCAAVDGTARCVVAECALGFYQAGPTTCLPVLDASCLPCTEDTNCVVPGNACVPLDGASYCAQDCSDGNLNGLPAGACKAGYTCTPSDGGRRLCLPETDSCGCLVDGDAGKTRACTQSNTFGTCAGSQTCDPDVGFSTCTARVPATETCNGLDDDCDGVVDEGASPPPQACTRTSDFGTCSGAWRCGGEAGWQCTANEPVADACNGLDDDCDGQTDEDFVDEASGNYVDDNHCGICNRDCDDVILFSTLTACRLEGDVPTCVALECEDNFYIPPDTNRVCIPTSGAASCSPCADDAQCAELPGGACTTIDGGRFCTAGCSDWADCDEGFGCIDGRCIPTTLSCTCRPGFAGSLRPCVEQNAAGACTGVETCDPNATPGWSACSAQTPTSEICNGLDDDCDGGVDEALTHNPTGCSVQNEAGVCVGTYRCEGADGWQCPVAVPEPEACDFQDDDCDGAVDEDFRGPGGRYVDDLNCGTCGNSCAGLLPNATATCVSPAGGGQPRCEVASCDLGYYQVGPVTCLPAQDTTCVPCATDDNCPTPGDRCLDLDGGRFCGRDCSLGNAHGLPAGLCDDGFECMDQDDGGAQCVPTSRSCSCLEDDRDRLRTCSDTTAFGTCYGTEVCAPESGWGGCTAEEPEAEICNGLDDDCDGRVDEEVVQPSQACQVANANGTCTASWVCAGDDGWVCDARTPIAELCNGVDDDCDGGVDEAFKSASGIYTDLLNCGACGISCVGAIPNATAACVERGAGARCEVATCAPGFYRASDLTCLPASDNTCSVCSSDASCPTPGDKCLSLDGGQFCGYDCAAGNNHGTPTGQCPSGFECIDIAGGRQCVPLSRSCACRAGDTGETRACRIDNGDGTCFGTETCNPASGWFGCDAETPAPEACNGEDDDCDGQTDEGVAHDPTTCDNEVVGVGTCTGTFICSGELGWQCPVATPAVEACDFRDNDCDGATDETFRNQEGLYVHDTSCGSCGISCAGSIPNATATCAIGPNGQPRCEVASCNDGYYEAGPLSCVSVTSNLCAPCGTDDDCPTPGDRCLTGTTGATFCGRDCSAGNLHGIAEGVCESGYTCTAIAGGPNQCMPNSGTCDCLPGNSGATRTCQIANGAGICFGTETCNPASGWVGCTARNPAAESCNGLDDDCDGLVDEAVTHTPATCTNTVAGVGTCTGTYVCQGAAGWQCPVATPVSETCNALDDDCDAGVDETFKNAQGLYVNLNHCGACGVSCVGAIPNATAACVVSGGQPRCEVQSCQAGYYPAGPLTCLPAVDNSCAPCSIDANCRTPGDRCLDLDGGRYCGRDCSATNVYGTPAGQCPTGFECADQGGGVRQCVPLSESCTCLDGDQGATRSCFEQNGSGICFGEQTCDPAAGWSDCSARSPATESCNMIDDDCDTVVDDVAGRGDACSITNGFGECDGVRDCVVGQSSPQCVAATPAAETCNSRDDNCDGTTDESFAVAQSCNNGQLGACQRFGITVCNASGDGVTCQAPTGTPVPETCDNIDNDCDGATDEVSWPDKGQPCTLGQGVCQVTGVNVCSANGATTQCSVTPPTPAVQLETGLCNNLDDNCDGFIDEAFLTKGLVCSVGVGVCTRFGNFQCNAGGTDVVCNATAGTGSGESCDLLDNDCDGSTDEDFKNVGGTKYDKTTTCGNCFTNCTAIYSGRANAFGTCDAGPATPACVMSCNAGFFNLNAVPDDGCEFGLDATAIYVGTASAGAIDDATCGLGPVGTGGTNHPCKTIGYGLGRAQTLSRAKVLVSDGLYTEQVTLRNGISLYGGYRADTWERHLASTGTTIRGNTPSGQTHKKTIIAATITSATVLEGFVIYGETNFTPGGNSYALYVTNSTSALTIRNNLIFAGNGGDASTGAAGTQGASGNNGNGGSNYIQTTQYSESQCLQVSGIPGNGGTAGDGGTNTCGGSSTRGGDGGAATCPDVNSQQANGATGTAISGHAAAGTGGAGGYDWYTPNLSGQNCGVWSTGGQVHDGRNGNDGGAGTFGAAGGACLAASNRGAVNGMTLEWGGTSGSAGAPGLHGGGGGGGGAGGGHDVRTSSCHPNGDNGIHDGVGGSGGGGGAGGCGGTSGGAGVPGGGAFGVFIAFTSASASLPVLTQNVLTPGTGGAGGNGGPGGAGGLGGNGGSGGVTTGATFASIMGPGGRGGQGGDGGHGGGGGGGCGGVSFALFVFNNSGTPNYHQAAQGNTFASGGAGGAGGLGGSSLGNTGGTGADGASGSYNY